MNIEPNTGEVMTSGDGGGIDRVRAFVALTDQKKALDAELRAVKEQIEALEPDVLHHMQENGIQSVNVDGYTVYLRRDIRASFKNTPEAYTAALDAGLQDALTTTIPAARASAIVREFLRDVGSEAPSWLESVFSWIDDVRAGIRKA